MYQIKCSSGYEIQVIGSGENGLSRIADSNNAIVFTGGYRDCEKWLDARAVKVGGSSGNNACRPMSAQEE